MTRTLFEDLGGEPVLRQIIDRFVDRVFDDIMIGFLFRHARRERVKQKEYEFAASISALPSSTPGAPSMRHTALIRSWAANSRAVSRS